MTAEQLQAARAAYWRQNQNPLLTLEDAAGWFSRHPLNLFLPRRGQLPAPAPSFAEACLGAANATPPYAVIEQANGLLARLMASDSVIGLNLLGNPGEQPDFFAHREILPFLISLRGERDWNHAPGSSAIHRVSPLVVELWKTLQQAGPLTVADIREKLGRELTESAVLRALSELWQSLRAIPVLQPEGQPAIWELLETHHANAVAQGSGTSQVTAISLLVSMYLQSVYAASGDEIEIFLSPLASRSRIREAVRGLSATRQIHSLSMETQTYYFLEDGLPKFDEAEPEQPKAVTPRRPRVAEPKRAKAEIPEWAKVAKPQRDPGNIAPAASAKFVPRPSRPVPSPGRSGPPSRRLAPASPGGRYSSRPRPDRGDFKRRKDSRPAYGKRPGNDQGRPGRRQDMAKDRSGREGFLPKQGASDSKRPAARPKERWRNTPGKPGYQPDRARPQGAAQRAGRSRPGKALGEALGGGGFSRPARPFSPAGVRPSPPVTRRPERPRGRESGVPPRAAPKHKFQDRGIGTQGFERPQRRPVASGTFAPRGQEIPQTKRSRPAGSTSGRSGESRFKTGKSGTGRPGVNRPETGKPGAGGPRAEVPRRPLSAGSDNAGGGKRSAKTRSPFGASSRPRARAGFPKSRLGHASGHGSASKSARSPSSFTRGKRPAGSKRGFNNRDLGSKDLGKKRPEA